MTTTRQWSQGHLVRIEQPTNGTVGWQARKPKPGIPRLYRSRFYADKKWGGKRMARIKARQWLRSLVPH